MMEQPPPASSLAPDAMQANVLIDMFIPGFSGFSNAVQRHLHIDLNVYIPLLLTISGVVLGWQYLVDWSWGKLDMYFMSRCTLRTDDEAYNYVMAWVAKQHFSLRSRRFIVNTNTNSRNWFTWWSSRNEDDSADDHDANDPELTRKPLAYTPDYGSHYFFYRGRLLCFYRSQGRESMLTPVSEKEEIYMWCFGRDPGILKALLNEARDLFMTRDEKKTVIYRGATKPGTLEPSWNRCMARTSRPFSTVILNDKIKKDLVDDVTDYLDPATRRWYSNRGIPYRRGYLLHGPPGTGKSSLSLALAGFFKMRIYMVSLSSVSANEETLATLFSDLPRRCVVLLEDIDSAGLAHTRESSDPAPAAAPDDGAAMVPGQLTPGLLGTGTPTPPVATSRISLSGLLNILDGVASQEGRVLIMTTNHIEKLDKALIRPGRVDMIVHFGRADRDMTAAIFKAIYAPLEGDDGPAKEKGNDGPGQKQDSKADNDDKEAATGTLQTSPSPAERAAAVARVEALAQKFADRIPAHEFSPAELQGFLMKNKRDPEAAVANAEEWVVLTRKEKADKEIEEAEEKRRKEEEEEKEKEKKKKKEEEEKERQRKKQEKREKKNKKAPAAAEKVQVEESSESDSTCDGRGEDSPSAESSGDENVSEADGIHNNREKARDARKTRRKRSVKTSSQDKDLAKGSQGDEEMRGDEPKTRQQQGVGGVAKAEKEHNERANLPKSPIGGDSGYET